MAGKRLSLQDRLLAAAVVFGGPGNVREVEFRLKAYLRLLELADEIEPGRIEEFDVINALEDLPSFKTREELRRIANDLRLLERRDDGLLRLKPKLYLDDYRPDEFPFSAPASVPVDFVREVKPTATGAGVDTMVALRMAVEAWPVLLQAAASSGLPFVTPFFRLEPGEIPKLDYTGTFSATTPFLDAYTLAGDVTRLFSELAPESIQAFRKAAGPWIDTYLEHLLADDAYGDAGALLLENDDDYPGAERPTVFSSAELVSVLVQEAAWRKTQSLPERPMLLETLSGLTRFVLVNQNPDGGWPIYRYRSESFIGKPTAALSVPFFSSMAFAGLLDAYFDGDPALQDDILAAAARYGELITASARRGEDGSVGWAADFSADAPIDLADTATNLQACLLLPLILKDQTETFTALAAAAVRHLASRWSPAPDVFGNIHRVTFRVPTLEGSAGLPMSWEHPGHAKILRALSQAYLHRIDPGFDGATRMAAAAAILARDCRQGFWLDVNRENIARSIINVNTGNMSTSALLFYEAALAKSRTPPKPAEPP
ncbi:MAG: hypothetical protein P9F75_00380 [Candidatus Contendobacter sp.]|nr:hypothetical protein [Candidatus Contendobacter sp.]